MGALIRGLAEIHVEFVLIHPFREGNGRIARLLADVMACLAGAVLNVTPMEDLLRQVLNGRIVDS
jgi:cell filamentation protein